MNTRRNFLRIAGLGAAALPVALSAAAAGSPDAGHSSRSGPCRGPGQAPADPALPLGIAGYTFLHVPVDTAITMMKRVGVNALSIKDFHLPLSSTEQTIHEVREKFESNGIHIYAAGVIYMKTPAEVDNAFEYARKLGVDLVVGVPNPELIPYTEQKVKSYNIRVAIHNHGPEDKLYPSPANVYMPISKLDPRIGLCLDIGHAVRAGADPVKAVSEYAPRLFDLHIKDLASASREPHPIELGRGIIDLPGLVKVLRTTGYAGHCSIEHEMDMNDPLPGIAESAGYFGGVIKTLEAS